MCFEDQLVDMRGCGIQSCLESLPCGDSCGLGSWEGLRFAWAFVPSMACPQSNYVGDATWGWGMHAHFLCSFVGGSSMILFSYFGNPGDILLTGLCCIGIYLSSF